MLLPANLLSIVEYIYTIEVLMKNSLWLGIKRNSLHASFGLVPGLLILAMATGIIETDSNSVAVPYWLFVLMGVLFTIAGISALLVGLLSDQYRNIFGAIILIIFYIIALWVSAGPGDRLFIGANPVMGRFVFGVSALVLLGINVIAWRMVFSAWRIRFVLLLLVTFTTICLGVWWSQYTSHIEQDELTMLSIVHDKKTTSNVYKVENIWDFPFNSPRALAVDSVGNIYVSETYKSTGDASRILKFDQTGVFLGWWGKGSETSGWHDATSSETPAGIGREPGEFVYVMKIGFDAADTMYVVDRGTYYDRNDQPNFVGLDVIQRFHKDGHFTGFLFDKAAGWTAEYSGSAEAVLTEPTCILVSGDDLLIGSYTENRLSKFSLTSGQMLEWFGKTVTGQYGWHATRTIPASAPYFGTEVGAFNGIIDCEMVNDRLYIVSYNSNPVIGVYSYRSGHYLAGLSHDQGHKPQEIIVDDRYNFIFSDNYAGSLKFFNSNLELVDSMQLGPGGNYFAVGDFASSAPGQVLFIEQQKQQLYELTLTDNFFE